jgi:type VI protein secretion system component VasK
MNTDTSWHLSKSVPISFIIGILMQTIALVWYVSTLDSAIRTNTRDLTKHETRIETLEKTVQTQAVAVARIDENIKAIRDLVEKMAESRNTK